MTKYRVKTQEPYISDDGEGDDICYDIGWRELPDADSDEKALELVDEYLKKKDEVILGSFRGNPRPLELVKVIKRW